MTNSDVSVLFEDGARPGLEADPPACFRDLNLDQVVDAITAGREEYDLAPFFHTRLATVDGVTYRHQVLHDLEDEALVKCLDSFADDMREMRKKLDRVEDLRHQYEREAWFVDAIESYCAAVTNLAAGIDVAEPDSQALAAFRSYVTNYVQSEEFTQLLAESEAVKRDLSDVRYCVHINGPRVKVRRYASEGDYSIDIEETFARFKRGAVKDYRVRFPASPSMSQVELRILDLVAQLYPEPFAALSQYCDRHRGYVDGVVARFDREIQFYLAYLEYIQEIRGAELQFCYPVVSDRSKSVSAAETFDIALASKLAAAHREVVRNDFELNGPERVIVVSGPNQGGKTTFARTFGQLHELAGLGLLTPGTDVHLYLCDEIFTHFERAEDLSDLSGKLEDDLVRIREILLTATADSVVIMNESFTSTTLEDARVLGATVLKQVIERDLLCVYVTFVDELSALGEMTVSMVSTVLPEDPATRTYKVVRRPPDGVAYAVAIAEKYGVTYQRLQERVRS